ncbi:MAG: M3 family oligoendopeptidase [bacterium]|nr:M3 family oligoendopeptidase [bacterium]
MMANKFKYWPDRPEKLTAPFAKKEYEKLLVRIEPAEKSVSPDLWLKLFADWNALSAYLSSEGARMHHAYNKNLADRKLASADKYYREKLIPAVTTAEHALVKALLKSQHKNAVANNFGKQLIPLYNSQMKPLDPINTGLHIEAGRLKRKYDQIIAAASVQIDGQEVTLPKARALATSENRALRQETFLATSQWFLKNQATLAGLFDDLVKLRTQMGKNLGYESYTPLAYEINARTDYSEKNVEQFRSYVQKHVVPLRTKILKQQAGALGLSRLKPWDAAYNPATTLPLGIAPINKQLSSAQKLFDNLSPKLGKHFSYMRRHGLIDLENRPHKWSSAYCTSFSDDGTVAVLCSSTGDPDDVRVLMHEMGHAFQAWESQKIKTNDLKWATADLAEVYSFGMEFLSLNYINNFFNKENADKFSKSRWEDTIYLLCYCCVVDEFQHWVYAHPSATTSKRNAAWITIANKYTPGIDWEGYEKYRGLRWYAQLHIFNVPFYYIDYALAATAAAQLAILDKSDHKQALGRYLKMCRLGGTKSFKSALTDSGLRSPFEESLIKDLANHAAHILL